MKKIGKETEEQQINRLEYIVGDSCVFLIPEYEKDLKEKDKTGVSSLLENSNVGNRRNVLSVAREALYENPEKFGHECLREKKCDKCPIFKKYN